MMFHVRNIRNTLLVATAAALIVGCDKVPEYDGDGPKMEFVRIPAGSFYMGSPDSEQGRDDNEGPVHEVRITKPFYMGKYEVTQAQWEVVMGTTLIQQHDKVKSPWLLRGEGPEHPMYYVSWEEAVEFCKRLGRKFRLPTEAEWEYACRAGSQTRFYYGDDPNYSELDQYAWYYGKSDNETHPVGHKKPNAWGLYDMHGNVDEWCSDRYMVLSNYENAGSVDPTGPASFTGRSRRRIYRGGNWLEKPNGCRSANRGGFPEGLRFDLTGFRVVYRGRISGDKEAPEIALPEKAGGIVSTGDHELKSRAWGPVISGVVQNEAGIPVDGVYMRPLQIRYWAMREYADGSFEICRTSQDSTGEEREYHFVARHEERNLAAAVEIDQDKSRLDVVLEPGVVLAGQVVDGAGKGIEEAKVVINLQSPDLPGDFLTWLDADAEGRFEIRALPTGYDYDLLATKTGHRRGKAEVSAGNVRDNRVDGVVIVLQRGQFSVSGVVVDADGKPVAGASVWCSGEGQVGINTRTDADGRFKADGIFEGQVKVTASVKGNDGRWLGGSVSVEGGATDVRVVLGTGAWAPPPKGRACFPADTDVWMDGELLRISEVIARRMVGGRGVSFGQIEELQEHVGAFECRDIVLENGNRIGVTGAHCFMLDSGQWVPAQDLGSGLRLKTLTGTVRIESVTTRSTLYIGKVCNLKIKGSDRYPVGKDGVIVRDY
jgi:formylglycine-generating enzyme required for sulfatase activity